MSKYVLHVVPPFAASVMGGETKNFALSTFAIRSNVAWHGVARRYE